MQIGNKQLLLIGDRLLIRPENSEDRTKVGLYLPQTVIEKQPVQTGRVVEVGPGLAIPNLAADHSEPWQERHQQPVRYLPVQAEIGDYALFLRKDAIEVRYQDQDFLVIPQTAILLLIRDEESLTPPGVG